MKIAIDTNVLVRAVVQNDLAQATIAAKPQGVRQGPRKRSPQAEGGKEGQAQLFG